MLGFPFLRLVFIMSCLAYSFEATAQTGKNNLWQINQTIKKDPRPLLCREESSIDLVVSVVGLGIKAQDEGNNAKAKRIFKLASKLQSEICRKPSRDDIVIVRCRVKEIDYGKGQISVAKLSALIREQESRGEQEFYAWTYNLILDSVAGDEITKKAHQRWCAGDTQDHIASTPEKLEITPRMILSVQYRLYDLGYPITIANGQQTGELVKQLSSFQQRTGLAVTGQIDKPTLDELIKVQPPAQWLAIAFTGAGRYGLVLDGASRRGAEERAIARLKRKSRRSNYQLISQPAPGCMSLAMTRFRGRENGRRMQYTNTFVGIGKDKKQARDLVLDYCEKSKQGGKCRIKKTVCSNATIVARPNEHRPNFQPNAQPTRYEPNILGGKKYDPDATDKKPKRVDPMANAGSIDMEKLQNMSPEELDKTLKNTLEGAKRFDPAIMTQGHTNQPLPPAEKK